MPPLPALSVILHVWLDFLFLCLLLSQGHRKPEETLSIRGSWLHGAPRKAVSTLWAFFFFARRAELDWAMDVSCLSGSGRFSSVFPGVAHVKGSMGGSSGVHFTAVGLISLSVNEG